MFISTKQLVNQYGVDETIARFFVDREPPANNLYWHEKLLYLRPSPGYLFIPLIIDLLYKMGLDKEKLISEEAISLMEQIGHITALEETKIITVAVAVEKCKELVEKKCKNHLWLSNVNDYFNGNSENVFRELVTPFKALHRGDIFLFPLAVLEFPETVFEKIAAQWFALISVLLLLDDADDIAFDKETGDENAYLESGLNPKGLERIAEVVKHGLKQIASVNPTLAATLENQHKKVAQMPHILQYLNEKV